MAILETEVLVLVVGGTVKHYEDKGYEIPRKRGYGNKLVLNTEIPILVKVEDLKEGSGESVTKVCDEDDCGKHIPNQRYRDVLKYRGCDGRDRCNECAHVLVGANRKNNMGYEKSLEYWAKANDKEYLLMEFSTKNTKLPSQVSRATGDEYWWDCPDCDSEYEMSLNARTSNGTDCPYCAGKRVNQNNCLWTTHPEIANLLHDDQRGYEITFGSDKKEQFTCPDCRHTDKKTVQKVASRGFSCKRCGDGISYPEKFMFAVLSEIGIDFETQKIFDWSENKRYDFHAPLLNMIIEVHGGQHYKETRRKGANSLKEEQENDRLKESLALNNGIKKDNYIIINCSESNMRYIKRNILNSQLAELYDLNNINWMRCNEYATSNLVKVASEYWNSGIKSTTQIGNLMKLHMTTVIGYLKRAVELGWCSDYDPKEVMRQNGKVNGIKSKKAIVQLSLNGDFIRGWESATDAAGILDITMSNISAACTGRYKKSNGFKWMFKEDYEKQLLQTAL